MRRRRCRRWALGPFMTEWRCLLPRKHEGPHLFEPDTWTASRDDEWRAHLEHMRHVTLGWCTLHHEGGQSASCDRRPPG